MHFPLFLRKKETAILNNKNVGNKRKLSNKMVHLKKLFLARFSCLVGGYRDGIDIHYLIE